MGAHTAIEWTDNTFNPWWGCVKISPGCAHCYAETLSKRTGNAVWGGDAPRRFFGDKHWGEPVAWNAAAQKGGARQRVFCASMADVFEDREDLDAPRQRLFDLIDATPSLTWLLLTKRPQNITRLMQRISNGNFGEAWNFRDHMPNVWLGTTVEDQQRADERIPELLKIRARVQFLSCEPLLGEVDVAKWLVPDVCLDNLAADDPLARTVSWVICGGESGPGARPMKPEWARSLRDQCAAADVPFFFKQWGEHDAAGNRVGKKAAGKLLDDTLHQAFPL
jgi:protein gp37